MWTALCLLLVPGAGSAGSAPVSEVADGLRVATLKHPERAESLLRSAMMTVPAGERPVAATTLLQASFDGISAPGFVLSDPGSSRVTASIPYRAKAGRVESALRQGVGGPYAGASVSGPAGGPWLIDLRTPGEQPMPTSPAPAVKITQLRLGSATQSMVVQIEVDHERRLRMVYEVTRVALQTEPQAAPALVELAARTAPEIVLDVTATALDVVMGIGLADGKGPSFKGFKQVVDPCEDQRIPAIVLAAMRAVPDAADQVRDLAVSMTPECWHDPLMALLSMPSVPFFVVTTGNPANTSSQEEVSPSSP